MPNPSQLEHRDILNSFCKVINIVEPEHPYSSSPYPIETKHIAYSYKQSSSSYYASCGPRNSIQYVVSFKADREYFNDICMERILAIFTHEVTHVTVGSHSDKEHGAHPPRFWREFGFNAHILLDNWDEVTDYFGPIDKTKFIGHIIADEVTQWNIDKRYGSAQLRKQEMARWFESTLKS